MQLFLAAAMLMTLPPGTIHHEGGTVSGEEMLLMLDEVQVVFIGEKHDDPLAHRWEAYIWGSLASPDRLLALEMFETDVQDLLDSYLAGDLSHEEFLEYSRPWSNYSTDYHRMVAFARKNGFQVIAANVPRHFASSVARNGWEEIMNDPEVTFFREISVDSTSDSYRNRFLETMGAIGDEMHSMPMDPMNMYRAQLLKDAVMAASIEGESCVFVCGAFHSDYHDGIPDQLPDSVSYLTVTVIAAGEVWEEDQADFIITR